MEDRNFSINFNHNWVMLTLLSGRQNYQKHKMWRMVKFNHLLLTMQINQQRHRYMPDAVFCLSNSWQPQFPILWPVIHCCCRCRPLPHLARDDRTQQRYKNISEKEVRTHQEERGESAKTHRHMPDSASIHPHRVTIVVFTCSRAQCGFQTQRVLSTLPEYSGNWLLTAKEL